MEYSTEQRVFIVESYHETRSFVKVQRAYRKRFNCRKAPSRSVISAIIKKFRNTGQVTNQRKGKSGRKVTKTTPENIDRVRTAIDHSPKKSVRRASIQLQLSYGTIRRILRNFLKMFPYKIQIEKPLQATDKARRLQFAQQFQQFLNDDPGVLNSIWFSDEAHFYLDGHVNKQNMRFWAQEQPHRTVARPLHPLKTTAWCAISAKGIIGPFFVHEIITADRYRNLILDPFLDDLNQQDEINIDSAFFQQDGARPHTANRILDFIHESFGSRVLSNRYPERFDEGHQWPPYSPDLNPCDYFLWGYLKDRVYRNNPHTVAELEANISNEVAAISLDTLERVVGNFARRLDLMVESDDGGHFENVLP